MVYLNEVIAVWLFAILSIISAQATPVQEGDMVCILDTTTGIMKASMAIYKNSAKVTRAYFTKPSAYDFVYDGTGCQWTGTGTDSDPFISEIEIDSQTNLPPSGKNGCGYEIINAEEQLYKWTVYNQIQNELGREGDVVFTFECSGKDTPNSISVQATFNAKANEGVAERVKPENQMSVLERHPGSNSFGQVVTDGVNVGQQIKLRIQTKVNDRNVRQSGIDHYGVYVFYCDYRTSSNGSSIQFVGLNGCGNNVFSSLLGTGFKFARFSSVINVNNERWFQTETDAFILVPSTPANSHYYLRCYVGYCYGSEGVDARCDDYCATSRSRRSLGNTTNMDVVSIQVKVKNGMYTEGKNQKQTGIATETLIIIIATVLGILLIVLLVALCVVCSMQRRRLHAEKEWSVISTTDSMKRLSYYSSAYKQNYPKF